MLEIRGWWGRCGVVVGCCDDGDAARRWEVDLVTRLRYAHVEPQRVTSNDRLPGEDALDGCSRAETAMDRGLQFVRAVICDSSDLLPERGKTERPGAGQEGRDEMR